jgi:hypothetical protein
MSVVVVVWRQNNTKKFGRPKICHIIECRNMEVRLYFFLSTIEELPRSTSHSRVFFRLLKARKHQKEFPCYKRYKNSRKLLDEKTKYQPRIIKRKPKLDENRIKIGENFTLHL